MLHARFNPKIIPHLWFDTKADEASKFYMSLFEGRTFGEGWHNNG